MAFFCRHVGCVVDSICRLVSNDAMTNQRETLGRLIKLAMEMEKRAYTFYDTLEKDFGAVEGVVECMRGIKEDEKLHLRVLEEIRDSLSEVRLQSPVTPSTIENMEKAREFMDNLDMSTLDTADKVYDAVQQLEAVEFDVVMSFVDADEINFEFTREYLKNETVDHAKRVSHALFCLD